MSRRTQSPNLSQDPVSRRSFLKGVAGTALTGAMAANVAGLSTGLLGSTAMAQGAAAEGATAEAAAAPLSAWQPKSDRKIRVGVVGGGFGLAFEWHHHPNAQVTAVCDIRPDRLEAMQNNYGTPNGFRDFRAMLKHPELDAVAVFTPAPLHAWMACEAMKAGKDVISAVPAGMSLAELEQLIACKEQTGKTYMMAETSYYRPDTMRAMQMQRQGEFGSIFYCEAEYLHEGLIPLMYDERGFPTWRHGLAPMHYPTHCTGIVIPVTGQRLIEVQCVGWGDGHEVLQTNEYENPFWNEMGFFRLANGLPSRIAVCWHLASGGTERAQFYGDRGSYVFERPEGTPDIIYRIAKDGKTQIDANGYPQGDVTRTPADMNRQFWEKVPESLRHESGHQGSHVHIVNDFIGALVEGRAPGVDIYEAVAYTAPGIVAHQSALKGGELLKITDYGRNPERKDYLDL